MQILMEDLQQRVVQMGGLLHAEGPIGAFPAVESLRTLLDAVSGAVQALHVQVQAHEQEREQLRALRDVTRMINSSLDLEEVLGAVMDVIVDLTGAKRSFLLLTNTDSGELEVRAACDENGKMPLDSTFDIAYAIIHDVARSGDPVLAVDALTDARFVDQKRVGSGMRSILCIPLKIKGAVTGVIYADNRVTAGIFDDSERETLIAFANQAAVAIENARLFEKVRARERRLQQRVRELTIEIDTTKRERQVAEITETDYFQALEKKAEQIRQSIRANPTAPVTGK